MKVDVEPVNPDMDSTMEPVLHVNREITPLK